MLPIDGQSMLEIAPRFSGELAERQAAIIGAVGAVLRLVLAGYAIDTRLRIAHFLAQCCHESAGFRTTEEFASGAAYEGRKDLGNTQEGDGPRFKGRGLLQLTGRANYRIYGEALEVGLVAQPERAAEPVLSLRIACEYWRRHGINALCDADDVVAVTRAINGGCNGLDDRRALTTKAKAMLARLEGVKLAGAQPGGTRPVLHRGARGDAVVALQRLLRRDGFLVAVDADFGAGTEVAVTSFQAARGMPADGVVGQLTWAALEEMAAAPVAVAA